MPTATSARSNRSRSSRRCEIRVPSASFSGSSLIIGAARLRGPSGGRVGSGGAGGLNVISGWRGVARLRVVRVGDLGRQLAAAAVGGRVRRRGGAGSFPVRLVGARYRLNRRRGRGALLCLARLLELHFLLELLAKLTRHGAGSSDPTAEFRHHARQLLRSQHDQRQDEN